MPKRKVGQLTLIKNFDLTKEKVHEVKDESDMQEKDSQSETPDATPVPVTSQDGPIRNCVASEKGAVQKKEDMSEACSVDAGEAARGGGDRGDLNTRLLGTTFRGALMVRGRGRGQTKAITPSTMEVNAQTKDRGKGSVVISSRAGALAQAVLVQKSEENQDSQMHHREQNASRSVDCPFGNGDTVNLSDTEGEIEGESMIVSEPTHGLLSVSLQPGHASKLGTPLDLDSDLQMDQILDGIDQVPLALTLSNGTVSTATDRDHTSTPMEVETSHPSMAPPPSHSPITVSSMQNCWALSDHRLYCQPGTWAKDEMEEMLVKNQAEEKNKDPDTRRKESLEQLTDAVHEFLESFYVKYGSFIPLSESDVLEHLKKKGNSDLRNSGLDIKGEMTRYRAGLASAPIAGFMVMYNKHTLSLDDLGTLEEQNWLNDQIINMYGELIMEATQHKVHFFNSFFHKQLVAKGYDGVKRWTKKVDLFSKWLVLIPIHLEIHWSLVTVTMATKTISYYDSQGIVFRHTTDNIMKYLLSEAREKKQLAFQKGWKITIIKGIPQQKNDSDCGVFVLEYCRRLSVKQPLLFSQDDMPRIRKRIYKELCDFRLND
ncbi:uncharacterized protein PAE49_017064 [Odontesthes bonariensis]|uniref:sentrin-specific protease 5 n=1 Tax=Odontesthes bonariensis TaxID=219752 RepID=UPI003F58E1F2